MSTVETYTRNTITNKNSLFSPMKSTVETSFYMNNTKHLCSVSKAYELSLKNKGMIVLDREVSHAEELGLPEGAKMLVDNGGAVTGRTAAARRIKGIDPDEDKAIEKIARQAIFDNRFRTFYNASAYVGLDKEFMVKAHLNIPEEYIGNLYNWLMNFQARNEDYDELYDQSIQYEDESDIFVYCDPDWQHEDYPNGLAYFDVIHNTAVILGLQYFGELKKGTLTLAWATAERNNYVPCHGGLKIFNREKDTYVASFFGLSGSGKSTLTHARHEDKYDIKVLHDDAFIIDKADGSSIALEPAYFDKTNDYAGGHPAQDYFVTIQNVGVVPDEDGKLAIQADDVRNGNGRTVKSRYSTDNRVDRIEEGIDSIFWIIKDNGFPPITKVTSSALATAFGLTLMTKRSTAENLVGGQKPGEKLVIEPFANPFRVYPLINDYNNFKSLFDSGVDCYLINTGDFMDKDIPKERTLSILESIVDGTAEFESFGDLENLEYVHFDEFDPDFEDSHYVDTLASRIEFRIEYIKEFNKNNPDQTIPEETIEALSKLIK